MYILRRKNLNSGNSITEITAYLYKLRRLSFLQFFRYSRWISKQIIEVEI